MSEEPQRSTTNDTESQEPDDNVPTPERQAELRAAYEKNVVEGKAPYARVEIRSLGELQWVMQERGWSAMSLTLPRTTSRPT